MSKSIGINFNYSGKDLRDGIFRHGPKRMENRIRDAFAVRGVEVHTVDLIDPRADDTIAVIYFDFNWKHWLHDTYLKNVPFEKRVLVLVEPANINPTAYYISFFRNHFSKVFAYDEILLKAHPDYIPHTILPFAEFEDYPVNRYADIPFAAKKLVCAISTNRWSYLPQSNYDRRRRIYNWFEKNHPTDLDLYGHFWNQPLTPWERRFGHYQVYSCYRGSIDGPYSNKMDTMARYKFAICFENCATRPGYISEKIRDCLCSRTVPIYFGPLGVEKRIPPECFINFRDIKNYEELYDVLVNMTESEYLKRVEAIDHFIASPAAKYFSAQTFTDIIVKGILDVKAR